MSGTTAVLLYVNNFKIYVGSVGDSRAILASIPGPDEIVE
jgi:serine/threonine protein phosphatase PrpC